MLRIASVVTLMLSMASSSFGADYGHVHLIATDPNAAAHWYAKHFGGTAGPGEKTDRVQFDSVPVIFFGRDAGFKGSVGTAVDHIGFSMADIQGTLDAAVADGAKKLSDVIEFGGMKLAFLEDPWGTKIEIIDDPETRKLHHLHLQSHNPEATLDWYELMFGGERKKFKGALSALYYDEVWLIVSPSEEEFAPTKDRAMDHLGWNFPDLDKAEKALKAKGVKFTLDPIPFRDIKIAFVEGPYGVRIELVQLPLREK